MTGEPARSSSPPTVYSPGDLLSDRYRLISPIGEGGMGTVWRAHSLSLQRDVAVKLIRRDRESAEAVDRLQLEARAAGALEHPSIVRVFDLGETSFGDPFLVMELLQGESLADIIDNGGPMREPRAVAMMLPVAAALQAAHEKGIVHRDVKPDNIFVVPLDRDEGTRLPKIVDFGLARLEATQRRLTAEGSVLGSPGYMAPEQAMGERDVDAQADVWAFCVVLYELVTGLVPFSGANIGHTIAAIIQLDPRPTTELMGGDPELWAILARGLAKAREDRWPGMLALRNALTAWAIAHGVSADVTGAPLTIGGRSERAPSAATRCTPLVPGPLPGGDEVESTIFEATEAGPIPVIDPPRETKENPILATPARRDNVTATPTTAPRSPIAIAIAILAVAVIVAVVAQRALRSAPADGRAIPGGAVAP
ncbi:MAG: serine/threonine-protein kinase [Byssovorax sp.]